MVQLKRESLFKSPQSEAAVDREIIAGMMSGTSCDGIDVALVSFPDDEMIYGETFSYSKEWRNRLLAFCEQEDWNREVFLKIHRDLSEEFAKAFQKAVNNAREKKCLAEQENILLIGSHGHTFFHLPKSRKDPMGATFQGVHPSLLAQLTGVTTVGDFRMADMARGGHGAPLLPSYHLIKFENLASEGVGVQNIGGIGNLTYLGPPYQDQASRKFAFDTGPGNILINRLFEEVGKSPAFDKGGETAAKGQVDHDLIERWWRFEKDYAKMPPPKSTGRERYSRQFFQSLIREKSAMSFEDQVASLTYFTAKTIVESWKAHVLNLGYPMKRALISGGGCQNRTLLSFLNELSPEDLIIETVNEHHSDAEFIEAQAFAFFARNTYKGLPVSTKAFTGAKKNGILGVIAPA
jgi:anhydro-N-acetylmuramic acid kinase